MYSNLTINLIIDFIIIDVSSISLLYLEDLAINSSISSIIVINPF